VPEYWTLGVTLKLCILFLHESFCCLGIYVTILFSAFFFVSFFMFLTLFSVVKNGFPNSTFLEAAGCSTC